MIALERSPSVTESPSSADPERSASVRPQFEGYPPDVRPIWDGSLDEYDDPRWIRVLAFVIAAAVAAYGSVGLFLAILGWYSAVGSCSSSGSAVFVGLCVLARPLLPPRGEVSRAAHIAAVLAFVAIVGITVWNVSNASQQVLIIRDGGTYLNAGKWISAHGTLEVKPFVGPFTPTSLAASSAGMSRQGDHLDFTLEHMFPALLADAQGVGGDRLMFATVPLLGGAALLAFYLLARRVLRYPLAALGAMLCLGLLMPQVVVLARQHHRDPDAGAVVHRRVVAV